VSAVDKTLTIHRIGVLPVTDNVNGLYGRYVETEIRETLKGAHRFDFREVKDADLHRSLADYEENSALAKKIGLLVKRKL